MAEHKAAADANAALEETLAAAYALGRAGGHSRFAAGETTDPRIVELGQRLKRESIETSRGMHEQSGLRVFFCLAFAPTLSWWYGELFACLRHTGIACGWAAFNDPGLATKLTVFAPTVVLAIESRKYLASAAPAVIADYKRKEGCLRLLNPAVPARDAADELDHDGRAQLARDLAGKTADGHFSLFARVRHEALFSEWLAAGYPYLESPLAFNPQTHFPVSATKDLDYFIVAGREPHRPAVAVEYLAPIFRRYYGLWGGDAWSFGEGAIPAAETPGYYARCRIAPNPLHPGLVAAPADLTQRTFAAAACGAFVLTLRTPVTSRFFADDELVAVNGPQEFLDAFDHFVDRPEERNTIVERGMRRAFADHTYFRRITDLVRFVQEHAERA